MKTLKSSIGLIIVLLLIPIVYIVSAYYSAPSVIEFFYYKRLIAKTVGIIVFESFALFLVGIIKYGKGRHNDLKKKLAKRFILSAILLFIVGFVVLQSTGLGWD